MNLKCTEEENNLLPQFSAYLTENLRHNKCCHCNKIIIPGAEIKRMQYNQNYEMHESCVEPFLQYWAVTLFEDFKSLDNKFNIVGSGLVIDHPVGHLDHDISTYIIKQLGNQVLDALPSGMVIRDAYISIAPVDECRMKQYIKASVRFFPVCMFCHGDRKLITPKHYDILNETDQIFPSMDTIRIEELKQTEDGKYIFHNSCLNDTINTLKCYHRGANGKEERNRI